MTNFKFNGVLKEILEKYPNIDMAEYLEQELQLPDYKIDELANRIKKKFLLNAKNKKTRIYVSESPNKTETHSSMVDYEVCCLSKKEFENFIEWLLKELGYNIQGEKVNTPSGFNLVAVKDNQKVAILARKYPETTRVSKSILLIAEQTRRTCDAKKSIVITTTYFNESAVAEAFKSNVELWDKNALSQKIEEVRKSSDAKPQSHFPRFEESLMASLLALEELGNFMIEPKAEGKYDLHLPTVKHPLITFHVQSGAVVRCVLRVKNNTPVNENEGIILISSDGANKVDEAKAYDIAKRYLEQFLD